MTDRHDDDEDENESLEHSKSREKRFQLWAITCACAVVAFGVLCDSAVEEKITINVIGVAFLSLVVATISSVFAIKVYNTEEEPTSGSTVEFSLILVTLLLWIINMCICFFGGRFASTLYGMVVNANLFHSLWIAFGCLIALAFEFLLTYRDVNVISSINEKGSRFAHWLVLYLTSFTLMVASTVLFSITNCRNPEEAAVPDGINYVIPRIEVFCNRAALAVGLGASSSAVCLMFISELLYVNESPEQLFESEALFSCLTCIAFAVGTGYITSDYGPGSQIGNLYYSTWFGLFISTSLVLSCFREYQGKRSAKAELRREASRI